MAGCARLPLRTQVRMLRDGTGSSRNGIRTT